jgi:hypothetical protein
MKKIFAALFLICLPAYAGPAFKYQTPCYLETRTNDPADICTVVETREKGGGLKTRNIYSNKFGLTIKNRWDAEKEKFMTWDSHNKFEYHWEYKIGKITGSTQPHTYVMPGVLVENISWD